MQWAHCTANQSHHPSVQASAIGASIVVSARLGTRVHTYVCLILHAYVKT